MSISQTVYYKPAAAKPATLLIIDNTRRCRLVSLNGVMTFGREHPGSECALRVNSSIVGRHHGDFFAIEGSYYYIDKNSRNGTYVNGRKLRPLDETGTERHRLSNGDILRIDGKDLSNPSPEAVLIIFSTTFSADENWSEFKLGNRSSVIIGRDGSGENALLLNDDMASRRHAELRKLGSQWFLRDLGSLNGIGLNGRAISGEVRVTNNDVIRISNTTLIFFDDRILYNSGNTDKVSLTVDIRQKTVDSGRKTLLKDIRAEFEDGDFVLILGGSGAGKTTLIRAILGESKAEGKIDLNGEDLYQNFKNVKPKIGIVPQFLTLRKNDTVRHTLLDTAAIKFGRSMSKEARIKRVNSIMSEVGITEHADKLIGRLSGGQQKKVSVANQMIGQQKVFICDEPDSGLDAASRIQQMEILHDLAKQHKVVMVISHEPDDAVEIVNGHVLCRFTKVLVLAKSENDGAGHLAFFGSPDEAKQFFGVGRLQDIMRKINPKTEGGSGRADEYINRFTSMMGVGKI